MIRGALAALLLCACGDDGTFAPCADELEVPSGILAGQRCDLVTSRWGASCVAGGVDGFEAQIAATGDALLRVWTELTPEGESRVLGELVRPGSCVGRLDLSALTPFAPPERLWVQDGGFVVSDVDGQGLPVSLRIGLDGEVRDADAIYPGPPALRVGERTAAIDVGTLRVEGQEIPLGADRFAEQLVGDQRGIVVLWRVSFGSTLGASLVSWDGRVITSRELGPNSYLVSITIAPDGAYVLTVPGTPGCGGESFDVLVLEPDLTERARRPLGGTAYLVALAATTDAVWAAFDAASEDTSETDLRDTFYSCRMPTFVRLGPAGEVLEATTPAAR